MPLIDIIIIAATALVTAVAVLGAIFWLGVRGNKPKIHLFNDISILFDRDLATHASPSALVALDCELETLTWSLMYDQLRHRFKDLPPDPALLPDGVHYIQALMRGDNGLLTMEKRGAVVELSLSAAVEYSIGHNERMQLLQAKIDTLERSSTSAPYPMWQKDGQGHILWKNEAYDQLARSVDYGEDTLPALFDDVLGSSPAPIHRRAAVTTQPDGKTHWFDASQQDIDGVTVAHAINIDAVIDAEVAQRNFVQTLAKTFAQLPIGLAIFDRKGQLALFNPALVELTRLPAEFLSAQPDLLSFFDRLRENRMMPEPKNYGTWRQDIADLIRAAADGRYHEIWTLESGQTYRVNGKPHPDHAVAFLIEDISAEVSVTRNFRAELDMSQSMMDALSEGLALFSPAGVLTLCNRSYSDMWGFDPEHSFSDITIGDSVKAWRDKCQPNAAWAAISDFVRSSGPRSEWSVEVLAKDGKKILCTVTPVAGGATMIQFDLLRGDVSNRSKHLKVAVLGQTRNAI
jgi:PAS domain-containing protein